MITTKEPISERFARDIATHQMEVLQDHEVYRHVRFKRPNTTCMSFSLVTFPGRLVYTGDMGTFVFERTFDMFEFFGHGGLKHGPNFSYWHEKLTAVDRDGGSQEYDVDLFRENLQSYLTNDWSEDHREQITEFIDSVVGTFGDEGPDAAFREVHEFWVMSAANKSVEVFTDFFERSNRRYTLRYEWACHAIQWGIAQYVASKSVPAEATA